MPVRTRARSRSKNYETCDFSASDRQEQIFTIVKEKIELTGAVYQLCCKASFETAASVLAAAHLIDSPGELPKLQVGYNALRVLSFQLTKAPAAAIQP
jgi:hypothetical protein